MKTKVKQTSIEAYHSLRLGPQQAVIMQAFESLKSSCVSDMAAYLHWEKSTVAGRMNELATSGAIEMIGENGIRSFEDVQKYSKLHSNSTGRLSIFYKIKEQPAFIGEYKGGDEVKVISNRDCGHEVGVIGKVVDNSNQESLGVFSNGQTRWHDAKNLEHVT